MSATIICADPHRRPCDCDTIRWLCESVPSVRYGERRRRRKTNGYCRDKTALPAALHAPPVDRPGRRPLRSISPHSNNNTQVVPRKIQRDGAQRYRWPLLQTSICTVQGGPKKVGLSYRTLSTSSLNIDQFSQLFTSRLCKNFATHWHAHHTYYVATLPCKT